MMYDVCAEIKAKTENDADKSYQYLVNASNASHLNLLLDKYLPKGSEVVSIQMNPDITRVQVINPKGNIIKVVTIDDKVELPEEFKNCEIISNSPIPPDGELSYTFCVANSIKEVLAKITELEFSGKLVELSYFTENVTYIR